MGWGERTGTVTGFSESVGEVVQRHGEVGLVGGVLFGLGTVEGDGFLGWGERTGTVTGFSECDGEVVQRRGEVGLVGGVLFGLGTRNPLLLAINAHCEMLLGDSQVAGFGSDRTLQAVERRDFTSEHRTNRTVESGMITPWQRIDQAGRGEPQPQGGWSATILTIKTRELGVQPTTELLRKIHQAPPEVLREIARIRRRYRASDRRQHLDCLTALTSQSSDKQVVGRERRANEMVGDGVGMQRGEPRPVQPREAIDDSLPALGGDANLGEPYRCRSRAVVPAE